MKKQKETDHQKHEWDRRHPENVLSDICVACLHSDCSWCANPQYEIWEEEYDGSAI